MNSVEKKLELNAIEDLAGKRALAEPLPGPLKDAFSLAPEIVVGPYNIRRFRDGDLKILSALENPFQEWLRACMLGDETGKGIKIEPTGQSMWDLAFIFTRPAKEVAEFLSSAALKAEMQQKAESEFGELRIAALSKILAAIIDQASIYASANVEYGPPVKEGEEGASTPNPPSSAAP